jgi:hypothetical protein
MPPDLSFHHFYTQIRINGVPDILCILSICLVMNFTDRTVLATIILAVPMTEIL